MAILIKPDGTETKVTPANGKTFTLKELQKHVGGYVEHIRLSPGQIMLVDEDGRSALLADNPKATALCRMHIVGNALVLTAKEMG